MCAVGGNLRDSSRREGGVLVQGPSSFALLANFCIVKAQDRTWSPQTPQHLIVPGLQFSLLALLCFAWSFFFTLHNQAVPACWPCCLLFAAFVLTPCWFGFLLHFSLPPLVIPVSFLHLSWPRLSFSGLARGPWPWPWPWPCPCSFC